MPGNNTKLYYYTSYEPYEVTAFDFKKFFMRKKSKRGRPPTGDVEQITRELNRHYKEMIRLMPKSVAEWAKLSTPRLLASYYLLLRLALSEKKVYHKVKWTQNPQAAALAKHVAPVVVKRLQTVAAYTTKVLIFSLFAALFKRISKSKIDPEKLQKFIDALSLLYSVNPVEVDQFISNGGKNMARAIAQKWSTVFKAKKTVVLFKLLKRYGFDTSAINKFTKKFSAALKIAHRTRKLLSTEHAKNAMKLFDDIMKFVAAGGFDGVIKTVSGLSDIMNALYVFKHRPSVKKIVKYLPPKFKGWITAIAAFLNGMLAADAKLTKSKPRKLPTFKIKKWSKPEKFLEEQFREQQRKNTQPVDETGEDWIF